MAKIDKYIIFIVLVLSIPAIWALLVPGFYGASDELHIAWLYEMYKTLVNGQIPPRFVPDLSFGFGYPLFNFVFPLPFYIGSIFHFLGLSFVDSIKLVFLVSVPLSGYFMYKLLRVYVKQPLSLLGALIYIYTPYRATDIYVRGAIGEVFSFVFFPLIILAFTRITSIKNIINYRWISLGALAISGLILSHNISSYMFLPFALGFGVLKLWQTNLGKKNIYSLFGSVLLGLVISSFFWVPAILESGLVKYSTTFDFWDHFPAIRQLFTPYFGYGASVPGPYDGMAFFMGYANIAVILMSLLIFFMSFRKVKVEDLGIIVWSQVVIIFSIILMNHRSLPIWKSFPYLPYFQFPWRFLTLITFTSSLLVVSLKYTNWKIFGIILLFFVCLSFSNFKPHDFLGRSDDYYLAKYVPYPVVNEEYLTQSEEYLRLPVGSTERPGKIYPSFFSDNEVTIEIFEKSSFETGANVESVKDIILSYNKYYFPGWVVLVDGSRVNVFSGLPYGQISFNVSSGKHKVEVYFEETNFRKIINLISLLGLIITICFLIKKPKK